MPQLPLQLEEKKKKKEGRNVNVGMLMFALFYDQNAAMKHHWVHRLRQRGRCRHCGKVSVLDHHCHCRRRRLLENSRGDATVQLTFS